LQASQEIPFPALTPTLIAEKAIPDFLRLTTGNIDRKNPILVADNITHD